MLSTYIVRRGDHLPAIAHRLGLGPDEVWDHPKNAELRALRKDWHILAEGDILTIPPAKRKALPIFRGETNRYTARVPTIETRLRVADLVGPFANEAYVLEGLGTSAGGTTDGDGYLTISAPVTLRTLRVQFPDRKASLDLFLGDMAPISTISGVQMRLAHRGFLRSRATGELDDATVQALRAFQRSEHLEVSGAIDDATVAALKDAFGC